ncbi:uncharacterized protein LOC110011435 [Sesamum indicum]|uniref:Uncharacterized protein LOC110011435 n=1 Tax=Sesamum indicum TaxID=4182 RepID=A0A8M8UTL9_SESIN|nr:uncharacterized protein LOC110011435 [Sesamum indicum]
MVSLLRKNADVFAWSSSDFVGVAPELILHRLNVDPTMRPVQQKKRNFSIEKNQVIKDEVERLLNAGYITEVQYTDWLSNVVVVPKPGGKWRVCIDFTNLNKACPKDPYPLPRIDALVDSTAGYELFSMMDAYQGYHQIFMAEEDQSKTSFVTERGIYCYKVMPFGLKNAGATYQWLVNKMFEDQIGRTMEVYVDDMLVKSSRSQDHIVYLEQTFATLRQFRMKLNSMKRTFGVTGEKFLGYLVSEQGIEMNPEKIEAILKLKSPTTIKEVQKLTDNAVSSALVREEDGVQSPIYYVSKMLQGAEKRYAQIEKLIEGTYKTKEESMILYHTKAKSIMSKFNKCQVHQIPRHENDRANSLSKFGATLSVIRNRKIIVMIKETSAITESIDVNAVNEKPSWKDEIVQYLKEGSLPADPIGARRLKARAARFTLVDEQLYKRTIERPLLKCLDPEKAEYIMREINEGSCGNHSRGRSLAQKVIRQGYFLPTLVEDTKELVKKCEACQKFAVQIHAPATYMEPVKIACPFDQWGIDILGPFPTTRSQKKLIVVAVVEYFSKWVEAEAVAKVEVANRIILQHLKTRLDSKRSWLDELPGVLWAFRTTPRSSIGETPFCLVFGTEALIPAEIGEESHRVTMYNPMTNHEERLLDLELNEEKKREVAYAKMLHHKSLMMRSYNKRLRPRQFQVGDLVLKKVEVSKHVGKLDPGWEGPYKVTEIKRRDTYRL